MNVTDQPTWLSGLNRDAAERLASNNRRIRRGSDLSVINDALADVSDSEIRKSIWKILDGVYLTDRLRKLEEDNASKLGPRSIAKPWEENKSTLSAYFAHKDYDPGDFGSRSGHIFSASLDVASKSLLKPSSAGLPYMRRKGAVLGDALKKFPAQVGKYACVTYWRTQEDAKTRYVWGYPISDTLWEQTAFLPWLKYEKTVPWRAALSGPDEVDRAMSHLVLALQDGELIQVVDFSAFDASVSPFLAYQAFHTFSVQFARSEHPLLYDLYRRFVTIPIFTPEGEWSGPHGVPSGSSWTNSVDSYVQWVVAGRPMTCQIQGDDGVYVLPRDRQSDFLSRFSDAGLNLNEDKSDAFTDNEALYLQRYYHPAYRSDGGGLGGVYPLFRAANRIKYPERWTDFDTLEIRGSDFWALRTITILENCKHHPGFEAFVKLVQSWDKYGLNFSSEGLRSFSRDQESKARAALFGGGSLEKGIQSFKTIALLKQ